MMKTNVMLAVVLLAVSGTGRTLSGASHVWTGEAGTDWFTPANWAGGQVPGEGDSVLIDGTTAQNPSVLLSSATPRLSSFTLTSATLTVTNWSTRLEATTVTIGDHGILTLPEAFEMGAMSNRVHIVCRDLTITGTGKIDADGKGWAEENGLGVGSGGTWNGGSGHGGAGGMGRGGNAPGDVYGSLQAPVTPGSGSSMRTDRTGEGHGGGVIRIEASGKATLDGVLTANGKRPSDHGAGASGGSIFVTAHTITGNPATARLSANGGNGNASNGGGGGGRIAIHTRSDRLTEEQPGAYIAYAGSANGVISVDEGLYGADTAEHGVAGTFYLYLQTGTLISIR